MNEEFRFVVRFETAEGRPVGVGCLVGEDLVATCAHVVADALGDRNLSFGDAPEEPVDVSFPFAVDRARRAARVVGWHPSPPPPRLPPDGLGDLAILRFEGWSAPEGTWVELSDRLNLAPHDFIAFGYPADMQDIGDFAEGRTVGLMPNAWYRLGAERTIGRLVEPGFSGGPVVLRDLGLVGGLIVLHDRDRSLGGGLMISGRVVRMALDVVRERDGATTPAVSRFHAPGIPLGYLPRPHLEAQLREALTGADCGVVMLTGPLGIGKSILAAAVAEDPSLREEFEDGIHWLEGSAAQSPLTIQTQLHRQLVGGQPVSPGVSTERQELEAALTGRRVLIVLDGIVDKEQLTALPIDCQGPAFLAISRRDVRPEQNRPLSAIEVGPLNEAQAEALLQKGAGPHWPTNGSEDEHAARVLKAVGGIPLLLALAGSQVRESDGDWEAVSRMFDLSRTVGSNGERDEPGELEAYMEAVVGALSDEDRRRYQMLAALPPEVGASWEVLQVLWDSSELDDVEVTANRLTRRALAHWTTDGELALHELQRAFVRSRVPEIASIHQQLVEGYRRQCRGHWGELADDGYVHTRLAEHMAKAGLSTDLETLHSDFGWLCRRLELGTPAGLASDLEKYGPTPAIRLLGRAVRQANRALTRRPRALASQVIARLDPDSAAGSLRALAREALVSPGLVPIAPSLASPITLRSVMREHEDTVAAVAISDDGMTALSASLDRRLRLWDLENGDCLAELEGHSDYARTVALSARSNTAVSGGYDGTVRVWDIDTASCRSVLTGNGGPVKSVAICHDARVAVSGGNDGVLRLWDIGRETCLEGIDLGSEIRSVALSGDGQIVMSATADGRARVIDVESGTVRVIETQSRTRAVELAPDGKFALLGGSDGEVIGYDIRTGNNQFRIRAHDEAITSLALCQDAGVGLSGSRDGFAKLFDLRGNVLGVSRPAAGRVLSVAIAKSRFLTGTSDGRLRSWDLDLTGRTLARHSRVVNALAVSPDGRRVASASDDFTVVMWDGRKAIPAMRFEGHRGPVTGVAFLDGTRLASCSLDGQIRIWDWHDGACLAVMHAAAAGATAIASTSRADRVVSGDAAGSVTVWDIGSKTAVGDFVLDRPCAVRAVAIGSSVVTAMLSDGRVEVWDLSRKTRVLKRSLGRGYPCTISPNGERAMATDHVGQVIVWDLVRDRCVSSAAGPDAHASCIAVIDERTAAIGCHDGSAYLWDVQEGEDLGSFEAATAVACAAGTTDLVAIGNESGRVHLLHVLSDGLDRPRVRPSHALGTP